MHTFNFHPMHVFLNSSDMEPYRATRAHGARLDQLEEAVARSHIHEGPGAGMMLRDLVSLVSPERTKMLKELR
jgi:hypothetical protein